MRILLTGKEGQVGFELRRALALLGEVHAIDVADCDLGNEAAIRRVVRGHRPDVIVNSAAYTAVDTAESESTLVANINAHAPGILALEAKRLGAMLVHFSTDYVFDGKKSGAYNDTDTPNPKRVYGVTKLAGEHAVHRLCTRHVLRTSWVVRAQGNNFAKTMLRLAAERDELNVVADQCGTPTSAAFLADLTAHLVRQANQPNRAETGRLPYGPYHATASGSTNWLAYASYVIERARGARRHEAHHHRGLPDTGHASRQLPLGHHQALRNLRSAPAQLASGC